MGTWSLSKTKRIQTTHISLHHNSISDDMRHELSEKYETEREPSVSHLWVPSREVGMVTSGQRTPDLTYFRKYLFPTSFRYYFAFGEPFYLWSPLAPSKYCHLSIPFHPVFTQPLNRSTISASRLCVLNRVTKIGWGGGGGMKKTLLFLWIKHRSLSLFLCLYPCLCLHLYLYLSIYIVRGVEIDLYTHKHTVPKQKYSMSVALKFHCWGWWWWAR